MVTPTKGARLGSSPAHERLILSNLATSLYEHGSIKTTFVRAKRLRPLAERLITIAKKDNLAARRQIMTKIRDKSIVHLLMTEIAQQFQDREGGYTRITKVERRKGDQAEMAIIELVSEPVSKKAKAKAEPKKAETTVKAEKSEPVAEADADVKSEVEEEGIATDTETSTTEPEVTTETADDTAEEVTSDEEK